MLTPWLQPTQEALRESREAVGSARRTAFIVGGLGIAGAAAGVSDGVMLVGLIPVLLLHTVFVLSDRSEAASAAPRGRPKLALAERGEGARERLP